LSLKHFLAFILRNILGSQSISVSPNSDFKRILVVRQHNQLGDMLCAVPLLRALKEKYPDADISLVASPVNYDVMLHNRYLNRVVKFDKKGFLGKGFGGFKNFRAFIRELRALKAEIAIVPSTVSVSFTSNLLAFLSGAQTRVGPSSLNEVSNPSAFFFNVPIALGWKNVPKTHQTQRNLDICQMLGLDPKDLSVEITFDSVELEMLNRLKNSKLASGRVAIGYHVGAGKKPNRWDVCKFVTVANTLCREFDATAVITSGPMDGEPVHEMLSALNAPFDLVKDTPIREVAARLATLDLLITNDTGIMHVGAAVGVPVLSLFGPTKPEQWAPLGPEHRWLRGKDGAINSITEEEVLKNAREMLHQRKKNSDEPRLLNRG
jgi:ADP-heptose:LPS heptosyltransferase